MMRLPNAGRTALLIALVASIWCWRSAEAASGGAEARMGAPGVNVSRLRNAVQVKRLARSEADLGYSVFLRGVSTFYDSAQNELVLQDGTGGVLVRTGNTGFELGVGQLLELEGTTRAGSRTAEVAATHLRLIGEAPLPPVYRVSETQLAAGEPDCCWVQVSGVVQAVQVGRPDGFLGLELASASNRIVSVVKHYTLEDCLRLVDAEVAILGVLRATEPGRSALWVPSMSDIAVTRPAPADPFDIPGTALGEVGLAALAQPPIHRIKVSGSVTLHQQGRAVFIQDNTKPLQVLTEEKTVLRPGDVVEVTGFPARDNSSVPRLEHALFRKMRSGPPPQPERITADAAANRICPSALVALEGSVLRRERVPVPALELQSSNVFFSARLPDATPDFPESVREGCRVRLTGIYVPGSMRSSAGSTFEILLRSPADVVLLEEAPSSSAHVLGVLLAGTLVVLAFLIGQFERRKRFHLTP